MFPAQALAEALVARGWRVRLSTDARGARYAGGFPEVVAREVVSSATPARGGATAKLAVPFRVGWGLGAAVRRMRRDRPAVVVGFGGYPSIPAMGAALILRVPALIHEQNGVLGRVNRVLAPRVARVACGTSPTALPEGVSGAFVGNPVRAAVRARAAAPYIPPGDHPLRVLVIGGSQGARVLSDVVPPSLALLPTPLRDRLRVSHQARAEDLARVAAFYESEGIRADVQPFFDDVPLRMAEAQMVVARAGASTLADLATIGRPAILIPLATAIADEQSANARGPAQAGAAVVLPEAGLTPEALSAALAAILGDPARAQAMARAALSLGRPDAAEALADLAEELSDVNKERG